MQKIHGYILFGLMATVVGVYGALGWMLFAPAVTAEEEVLLMPTRIVEFTQVAAQPTATPLPTGVIPPTVEPTAEPSTSTTVPSQAPTQESVTAEPTRTKQVLTEDPAQDEAQVTEAVTTSSATVEVDEVSVTEDPAPTTSPDIPRSEMGFSVGTREVTISTCDSQELIDALNAEEDIINLNGTCTYSYATKNNSNSFGSNALPVIDYDVTINGNGATIERDGTGGNFFRLFFVTYPGNLTLNDVTLLGGDVKPESGMKGNGGAILIRVGTLTLNNVNMFGNNANYGGAIYIFDGADMVADSASISGNTAYLGGGGIYTTGSDSQVDLTDTVFFNNDGLEGGAIYMGGGSDLTATTSTFGEDGSPNEAGRRVNPDTGDVYYIGRGGAIYSAGSGTSVILDETTLAANRAYVGGAIYNVGGAHVTVQDSSMIGGASAADGNIATADGGGVYNQGIGSRFVLDASSISYNAAETNDDGADYSDNYQSDGGGIFNRGGAEVIIYTGTVANNRASSGGGIFTQDYGSNVKINMNSVIEENTALNLTDASRPENGGGIYNIGDSGVSISNTIIQYNTANDSGGGLFQANENTSVTIEYTDFLGNVAGTQGGGLTNKGGAFAQLFNVNFTLNVSSSNGGAIYSIDPDSYLDMTGSTIEHNTALNGGGIFVTGSSQMVIYTSSFLNNVATSSTVDNEPLGGGGMFVDSQATVTIYVSSFEENSADSGAGMMINGLSTVMMYSVAFIDNSSTGSSSESFGHGGGAIRVRDLGTSATINNATFSGNSAQDAGAILVSGGALVQVTGSSFTNNTANGVSSVSDLRGGGAFWVEGSNTNVYVTDSTFTQNSGESGAVIQVRSDAYVEMTDVSLGDLASLATETNTGDTILHIADLGSQLLIDDSDIRSFNLGTLIYNDNAFLTIRQSIIQEANSNAEHIVAVNDGDFVLDEVRTILVNVTINDIGSDATFLGSYNLNPIELYSVTVVAQNPLFNNETLLPQEGQVQVFNSILETTGTACTGTTSAYSSYGFNIVSDASCGFSEDGDLESTDAQLTAQTESGNVLYYEPDPLGAAAGHIPAISCDIDDDQLDNPRPRGRACEPGAIEIVEAYAAYTSVPPANSDILLEPLAGESDSADIDITDTGTKDLTITSYTLEGAAEITVSGDTAPFTITDGSGATRTLTVTCDGVEAATEYEAVLTVEHTGYQETATYQITCEVGGATQTPTVQTVGLYQAGMWWIGSSDETPYLEDTYAFGSTTAGWQPIVGDWNGDGIATAGLYKEGFWILREVSGEDVTYHRFRFGYQEAGWQAIVGDWNGDGVDSIGLYKDGVFILRNSNSEGAPSHTFRLGSDEAGWIALSGDWDGDFVDSIGLYKDGVFILRNSNSQGAPHHRFRFGNGSGYPLAGDWDGDGTDTIGIYDNPNWLLRNSNSQGGADRVFQFGYIGVDFIPVIGTYSVMDGSGLDVVMLSFGLAVLDAPAEEITEEPTLPPTQEVTEEPQPEITPEVTEEPTALPTELPTDEVTEEPLPEVTAPVETTPEVTPSPTQTETPTEAPVETTPEVTPSPTPTKVPTEATPEPIIPAPEVTPESTPEVG